MIFLKGGAKVESTVLFGKYQICRTIGQGRSGTVFLARHLSLDEYRAVKRVDRDGRDDGSLFREAMILKALKDPGIPVVYDFEQDEHYYYLIEEYLDGESLFTLIKRQGGLSRAKTISFGMELCRIMNYLHSLKPNPILYLDLQPKNLLICDGALKLIDFDQAVSASLTGSLFKRYGTAGFAAPEQYGHEPMDVRTDIYAIGVLLHYMGTGKLPDGGCISEERLGKPLSDIIRQCIRPSRDERYPDVSSLLEELAGLKSGVFAENQISLLTAAVVCSSHGMGATHASFNLCSYLTEKGLRSLYMECNDSGLITALSEASKDGSDRYGIFHMGDLEIRPRYGECVKLSCPRYDAVVKDFGSCLEAACAEDFDLIILMCGGKWWELTASEKALCQIAEKNNVRVIFNHLSPDGALQFSGSFKELFRSGLFCYRMPFDPDPQHINETMRGFWEEVMDKTNAGKRLSEQSTLRERRTGIRNILKELLARLKSIP